MGVTWGDPKLRGGTRWRAAQDKIKGQRQWSPKGGGGLREDCYKEPAQESIPSLEESIPGLLNVYKYGLSKGWVKIYFWGYKESRMRGEMMQGIRELKRKGKQS
jgi:hypothetical protein